MLVLFSFEGLLPMSQESKTAGAQYASYLRLLPQSVVEANNRRAQEHAQKVADAFAESFAKGTCPVCKNALTSYAKDAPCLHWLLRPEGFEKDDFPRIAERYSLAQVELFMRRVANQEAFAKNINDMASEGTGKLVELTAKGIRTLSGRSLARKATMTVTATPRNRSVRTITSRCGSMANASSTTATTT